MYHQSVWDEPLLVELSRHGRIGYSLPNHAGLEEFEPEDLIPSQLRRARIPLPEVAEPQVVRHYHRLAQMNFGVDSGPYPLGSCTMKYNPKLADRIAALPCLTRVHPYQPVETCQGVLSILFELGEMLAEITGTQQVSLAPAAGAQGEFVGASIMRAKIRERQELAKRDQMLIPDSAHGTNPASAAMAGFGVVKVPSTAAGLVDVEALKGLVSPRTAGMMLTVPNTLGLFERDIREITGIVHEAGGLMYYDGANMNALLGRVRPGDMGFDIVHMNVHKTFATPHGGGGPGAGPVGVARGLVDYLPVPLVVRQSGRFALEFARPKSIGRVKAFLGQVGVLVRAYVYLRLLGREGLREVSEQAVLAANYLARKLDHGAYRAAATPELRWKHEMVVSTEPLRKKTSIRATDVAKALLDEGLHAPTIYFPLTVPEALMIEPTETESVEQLDTYADALNEIAKRAEAAPEEVRSAPRNTRVGRLDEVRASHPTTFTPTWRAMQEHAPT
jgi:glycine dehydrogenase subunit 2